MLFRSDKVLVHRKNGLRINQSFPYKEILKEYKEKLVFISSNEKDYETFPYKNSIPFLKMETLNDWFTSINSCEMIVSNLTGPTAIANAMNKLRIIELPNTADIYHTIGEDKFSKNIYWYLDNQTNNLYKT